MEATDVYSRRWLARSHEGDDLRPFGAQFVTARGERLDHAAAYESGAASD
jgi:hypothetical protein